MADSKPMSLRGYASRRGVSAMAVSAAVKSGRLKASVVYDEFGAPKIGDPILADREWDLNTDLGRAPDYVKARAAPAPADLDEELGLEDVETELPEAQDSAPGRVLSLTEASAAEKGWRAKLAELKYREQAGQLVQAGDVSKRLTEVFSQCRTRLLGLPSRAKQALPHLTVGDLQVLEGLLREALEDLASS